MNPIKAHTRKILLATLAIACVSTFAEPQPNIVLIMCDDMGFSDIGAFGGEIRTPNLDALATEGVRFSQFKNTSRCCPSRAVLMTGRHQHAVDLGWMTAQDESRPGYRGQLADTVPTIAEILKKNGYRTFMSGKWHLTLDANSKDESAEPNGSWPTQRGFDEYYGTLSGGGDFFKPRLVRNTTRLSADGLPTDYYYTTAITGRAVEFIRQHQSEKPLFLYIAHYAPHRPWQAPEARVADCVELYKPGMDVLRAARYERLREMGILPAGLPLPVHHADTGWNSLSKDQRDQWIKAKATYAAMVEMVDDGVGEVVQALKDKGIYGNTAILFLSDNGATKEGGLIVQLSADLSNTPYKGYKAATYLGGISSPFIVHYPKRFGNQGGTILKEFAHISDVAPTCLDLAGIEYPKTFKGDPIAPTDGISLVPAIQGKVLPKRDLFFEHESSCSIISGGWKLVRASKSNPWQLHNLENDPFEQNNVAAQFPEKAKELEIKWVDWANTNHVLPFVQKKWNAQAGTGKKNKKNGKTAIQTQEAEDEQ